MLADEQNVPRYVAASDGPGRMLELVEGDTGQGPCTEAFVNNTAVASTDVTVEARWPDLALALRPHPVRAVLGLPVRLGGVTVGTLDVFLRPAARLAGRRVPSLGPLSRGDGIHSCHSCGRPQCRRAGRAIAVRAGLSGDHRARCGLSDGPRPRGLDGRFQQAATRSARHQSKIGDVAQRLVSTGLLPTEASSRSQPLISHHG